MSIWPWLNEACLGEFIWKSRMIGHKLSHQSLSPTSPSPPSRAGPAITLQDTLLLQLHHSRHCTAPKTPSFCPRDTHPPFTVTLHPFPSVNHSDLPDN